MSDEDQKKKDEKDDKKDPNSDKKDSKKLDEMIQAGIKEALKPIKEKLDKAYESRDDALSKLAALEEKKQQDELKRLEEEGKYKEAYELKLEQEKIKNKALKETNTKLTRDSNLRTELSKLMFRSANASKMAYNSIVNSLIQDDKGIWIHESGVSIKDFVSSFAVNEDNDFLFKQKRSSGGGSSHHRSSDQNDSNKPLIGRPQSEVLKMAQEGKLPNQRR